MPTFQRLNDGWNAEPNAPAPRVAVYANQVVLTFYLNCFVFDCDFEEQQGALTFRDCARWRLGPTNDEGWYRGQCRYSRLAPEWGEFYLVAAHDPARDLPTDWQVIKEDAPASRHFLFYLRDETFECLADDWSFAKIK